MIPYALYSKVRKMFKIKRVIFNKPATIVFWNDGTKTVVKTQKDEVYDPEKGLTMAVTKNYLVTPVDIIMKLKSGCLKMKI